MRLRECAQPRVIEEARDVIVRHLLHPSAHPWDTKRHLVFEGSAGEPARWGGEIGVVIENC